MNLKELEEKLALTASEQSRNNGLAQNCPRCGMTAIKHSLASNALSRNHKIYVCDACGTAEALAAANNSHEPSPAGPSPRTGSPSCLARRP